MAGFSCNLLGVVDFLSAAACRANVGQTFYTSSAVRLSGPWPDFLFILDF